MQTETIELSVWMFFAHIAFLMAIIIILLYALLRVLPKRQLTVDDPTGEKKQKIFDTITGAIDDLKSTV